jgi:predicted HTH domain antitoxin
MSCQEVPTVSNRQLVIDVPETVLLAEKSDEASFGLELKVLAAVKLYELGRLTSGRAAELAGMSRVEFLSNLSRYKVFPLEAELRDLEAGRG